MSRRRGPKPGCECGECRLCRHREQHARYAARKNEKPGTWQPTDDELDDMMTRYFLRKGWDRLQPWEI